jgi:hypothetical protein
MSKYTTYWDNNGKYQTEYELAWKQHIPMSGEAKDGLPEALRCISRIGYDYFNNGFCNLWQSWEGGDTVMDSYYESMVEYLQSHIPYNMHRELIGFLNDAKGYGNWSDRCSVIEDVTSCIIEQMIQQGMIAKA